MNVSRGRSTRKASEIGVEVSLTQVTCSCGHNHVLDGWKEVARRDVVVAG